MRKELSPAKQEALHGGLVIPAHPLALGEDRKLDERRQRALTRYYVDAGAGGIAVGVHTTQFEIRDQRHNLFERVLRIASEEVDSLGASGAFPTKEHAGRFLRIAGLCGPTSQALGEAEIAIANGYDAGLLSMGGLGDFSEGQHLDRIRAVAGRIPVFGFYLQPSVGGRVFSYDFWRGVADLEGLVAIKIAPFNRYRTIDVVRAVCNSPRCDSIALYTGNDDNIINDLFATFRFVVGGEVREKRIVGGLLGHWAVWTRRAVELLGEIKAVAAAGTIPVAWMTRNIEVTDANSALFDAAHDFVGSIAGVHEVLRRQGLLEGTWCLNPEETLSPGQAAEIDRIYRQYPDLNDDEFVESHLSEWLDG